MYANEKDVETFLEVLISLREPFKGDLWLAVLCKNAADMVTTAKSPYHLATVISVTSNNILRPLREMKPSNTTVVKSIAAASASARLENLIMRVHGRALPQGVEEHSPVLEPWKG